VQIILYSFCCSVAWKWLQLECHTSQVLLYDRLYKIKHMDNTSMTLL